MSLIAELYREMAELQSAIAAPAARVVSATIVAIFPACMPLSLAKLTAKHYPMTMDETSISIIDALRGQQEQLKRLIAQPVWISNAPKATLSEMEAQIVDLKRLLTQLETDIQEQLKKGR